MKTESHEERINRLLNQVNHNPYEGAYYTPYEIYEVVKLYLAEYNKTKRKSYRGILKGIDIKDFEQYNDPKP